MEPLSCKCKGTDEVLSSTSGQGKLKKFLNTDQISNVKKVFGCAHNNHNMILFTKRSLKLKLMNIIVGNNRQEYECSIKAAV